MNRLFAAAALAAMPSGLWADMLTDMRSYAETTLSGLAADPQLQTAIRRSNTRHEGLSEQELVALDSEWRAEVGANDAAIITDVLNAPVSDSLRMQVAASEGIVTEIIVMDNSGMNVAISDVTSDYWQGDEDKFLMTYPKGVGAVHLSEVEFDESSQTYSAQLSYVVQDATTGAAIGAITVGLNAEAF